MQSVSHFLQSGIVIADKVCDYIPFRSHYNNLICIIAKGILFKLESYSPSNYAKIQDTHLVKHLNQKSVAECLILCIPIFNFFYAFVRDNPPKVNEGLSQPSESQQKIDPFDAEIQEIAETLNKERAERRILNKRTLEYKTQAQKALEERDAEIKKLQENITPQSTAAERELLESAIDLVKSSFQVKMDLLSDCYYGNPK